MVLRRILRILLHLLIFSILTLLTQVGGLIYIFTLLTARKVTFFIHPIVKRLNTVLYFCLLYSITCFLLLPIIAKPLGKETLPISGNLRPHTAWTWILNRHYVSRHLFDIAEKTTAEFNMKYPGAPIYYLDANFPFINGFPLFPHLSHDDGNKLDLSFMYVNKRNQPCKGSSFIGYGASEEPAPGEQHTSHDCNKTGNWQYSFMNMILSQGSNDEHVFDQQKTKTLVVILASQKDIQKIFIEPHLKSRLHLTSNKVRFQGCHSVRHDDHIHIQL